MDIPSVYIYCFARSGAAGGIGALDADCPGPVAVLERGKAAAVYRNVLPGEFSGEILGDGPRDRERVIRLACHHERVVEGVMRCGPVIPVRFGTVLASAQALESLLADQGDEIAGILDRLSEKDEWAVKGFVDAGRAGQWLLESDPALARRRRELPETAGARYFCEKRLEAEVQKAVKLWACAAAEDVCDNLMPHVLAECALAVRSRDLTGRPEDMAFNLAFFVARNQVAAFRSQVAQIGAARRDQGLLLEVSGPWPPYNFCLPVEARQDDPLGVLRSE